MESIKLLDLIIAYAAVSGPILIVVITMTWYQHVESTKTRRLIEESNKETRKLIEESNRETRKMIEESNKENRRTIGKDRDLIENGHKESRSHAAQQPSRAHGPH